jgi:magnesium transporter
MARLGGFLQDMSSARGASQENVIRRFWHRLPWRLVGLLGALISAHLVGAFEAQLQDNVALAFFIPGIVYLADAVGTQTETLVIRGLSVGVGIGQVV